MGEINEELVVDTREKRNKPHKKFLAGGVEATIWKNKKDELTVWNITLHKNYKDKEGEWKNTHSLFPTDLPKAVLALSKAYEHLMLWDDENGKQ